MVYNMFYCPECWLSYPEWFKNDKMKECNFYKLGCIHNYKKNTKNIIKTKKNYIQSKKLLHKNKKYNNIDYLNKI